MKRMTRSMVMLMGAVSAVSVANAVVINSPQTPASVVLTLANGKTLSGNIPNQGSITLDTGGQKITRLVATPKSRSSNRSDGAPTTFSAQQLTGTELYLGYNEARTLLELL